MSERFPVDLLQPVLMPPIPQDEGDRGHNMYATLKGGYYAGSAEAVSRGYIINLALGHYFTRWFALEIEVGYLDSDGGTSTTLRDIQGVPIMANARLSLPVWILEAYGGAGLGGLYYDADGILSGDDVDGWLFAGNVFLGGDLALADTVTLGVEAKYYMTEDTDFGGLDAIGAFLTLGVRF